MSFIKDLNAPLLRLSPEDVWTLDDATKGVSVFGGIGSGKTSGSGKMLAGAYLRAGFGGLVTCVKPGEVERWKQLAAQHRRSPSITVFDEQEGFNFLDYELTRHGMDGIGTVVECLMRIIEAAKRASATSSQKGGEAFWEDQTRALLRYTIPPLYAATGTLSISDILRFLSSAPTERKAVEDAEWKRQSFMYQVMEGAANHPKVPIPAGTLQSIVHYWTKEFPAVPEKTQGNMIVSVSSVLDRFRHGRLKRAFCERTTIVPELSLQGAVICLGMPTVTWNEDGVIAQQLFKYLWQRSVLTRNSLAPKHRERPVFLFSDEAQETVSSYDGQFLALCRDSKCCVTYLSQSLPTYVAKIGGDNPHDDATGLIGKCITHIYHANACAETNEYASRTLGKVLVRRKSYNVGTSQNRNYGMNTGSSENQGSSSNHGYTAGHSGQGSSGSSNHGGGSSSGSGSNWGHNRSQGSSESETHGYTEAMENQMEAGDFARVLKTGGKANNNIVTGVWFQSGRMFKASGTNMLKETFVQ